MLFILNDQIVELEIPEVHLSRRQHVLGCGDIHSMRARDALDYAARVMAALYADGLEPDTALAEDLAALIITKTGANAALFPKADGPNGEPRLTILPEAILEQLRERAEDTGIVDVSTVWPLAA